MKQLSLPVIAALLAALLFAQCKKEDTNAVFNVHFYTTETGSRYALYIDNSDRGELPFFASEPACGSWNGDALKPLSLQLTTGWYRISGKDSNGRVFSTGMLYISPERMEVSGGGGGMSASKNGDCVVVGLFE